MDYAASCKNALSQYGFNELTIPHIIQCAAALNPRILCNELPVAVAKAILEKDKATIALYESQNMLVHQSIRVFLKGLRRGDTLGVHHYSKGQYYTSVIRFQHYYDGIIIQSKYKLNTRSFNGDIQSNDIIALVKLPDIPTLKKGSGIDNEHEMFLRVTTLAA